MASHRGSDYLKEQGLSGDYPNVPGAVVFERKAEGSIYRTNSCVFGPGDLYCSMWNILALARLGEDDWTPQFNYWTRPKELEDGGGDVVD